jgi:4-hydroxybenzoate polyprenyltransferase
VTSLSGQLVRASHPGPVLAVTGLAGLLALSVGHRGSSLCLLVLAVGTGQLSIGWCNDLLDADRDRQVHRSDKPLATGTLSESAVRTALGSALAACVPLSLLCGAAAGLTHLVLVVGAAWAYNLGLKATAWSWLPYAVAFGALPAVVTLAGQPAEPAPGWMILAGALLGVGAHFVNVLPDLDDDARTGVRGLPHRIGRRRAEIAASVILALASVVAVVGPATPAPWWAWAALGAALALAAVGTRGGGRTPFHAAIGIAAINVAMLVLR